MDGKIATKLRAQLQALESSELPPEGMATEVAICKARIAAHRVDRETFAYFRNTPISGLPKLDVQKLRTQIGPAEVDGCITGS